MLITFPFFEIFLGFSFKHLFSNDLDVLLLNLCTFFKGLFALFCHFFKGLSVAKIQNFLLKGKVFPFSPIITLMQGKPAGNHFGAERDGGGKNQNRKGQDHGALSHGLAPFLFHFFIHSHCILMQVVYLFSQPFW